MNSNYLTFYADKPVETEPKQEFHTKLTQQN